VHGHGILTLMVFLSGQARELRGCLPLPWLALTDRVTMVRLGGAAWLGRVFLPSWRRRGGGKDMDSSPSLVMAREVVLLLL
jgi:hypothetical protein